MTFSPARPLAPSVSAVTGRLPQKAEHALRKKFPKKHSHYNLVDFLSFDSVGGTITDWNNARSILTSEDFIVGLIEGLEEEVGGASGVVMYNIGREWGKRDAKFFQTWYEREYERDIYQSSLTFLLEAWWWPFTSEG